MEGMSKSIMQVFKMIQFQALLLARLFFERQQSLQQKQEDIFFFMWPLGRALTEWSTEKWKILKSDRKDFKHK